MSGYIFGNKESFDQTEVQDKFIGGARYAEYLAKRTREERTSRPTRFTGDSICDTLSQFLKSLDSPKLVDDAIKKSSSKFDSSSKSSVTALAKRFKSLATNAIESAEMLPSPMMPRRQN